MKLKTLISFFLCTHLYPDATVEDLTLDEKVGQILIAHFVGDVANEDSQKLINDIKVGGIIYYNWSNKLQDTTQVTLLSESLQNLAKKNRLKIPLFISVDQEGGVVNRLSKGVTIFPGNRALGEVLQTDLIEKSTKIMGQELALCGVNVNFAPCVDVNNNPRNPIIGIRSFGNDPNIVTDCAQKAIKGFHKAGLISCLKHFPGHGDVDIDSHDGIPVIKKSLEELEACELVPYKKLAAHADMIMTAHLQVDALDKDNSSTCSEKTLSYLRNQIGFKGVIISDSITMSGALKNNNSVNQAAVAAFKAGCDVILIGGKKLEDSTFGLLTIAEIKSIKESLVEAVKKNEILMEKLDASVKRILALKKKINVSLHSGFQFQSPSSLEIAEKIAEKALSCQNNIPLSLKDKKILVIAPKIIQDELKTSTLANLTKSTNTFFFPSLNLDDETIHLCQEMALSSDVLIFCSYNAWKNPEQKKLIDLLIKTQKPFILIATRDPLDSELFEGINKIFTTFSPSTVSLKAVAKKLYEDTLK